MTAALQAIEPNGELGPRWIDEKGYFEECGCLNSPAVTSSGHILVLGEEDEIEELPSNLSSSSEVKLVFQMPVIQNCGEGKNAHTSKNSPSSPAKAAKHRARRCRSAPKGTSTSATG